MIATAGLVRLHLEHRITARLTAPTYLHAVGQGALAIEIRTNDADTLRIVRAIDHRPSRLACLAERSLLRYLQGGCSAPIAVQSSFRSGNSVSNGIVNGTSNGTESDEDDGSGILELVGTLLHPKGGVEIRARHSGFASSDADAEAIGIIVAEKMLALGAGPLLKLIDEMQRAHGPSPAEAVNGVPVGDTKTLT